MDNLYQMKLAGQLETTALSFLQGLFHDEFLAETTHGYVYRKPLGYAGDFRLIDMIYKHHQSDHKSCAGTGISTITLRPGRSATERIFSNNSY